MPTVTLNGAGTTQAITPMTATGYSSEVIACPNNVLTACQATVAGSGSVSATVELQATLDGTYYKTIKSFSLSGTTNATDIQLLSATFLSYRWYVSAISGTSATVTAVVKA